MQLTQFKAVSLVEIREDTARDSGARGLRALLPKVRGGDAERPSVSENNQQQEEKRRSKKKRPDRKKQQTRCPTQIRLALPTFLYATALVDEMARVA